MAGQVKISANIDQALYDRLVSAAAARGCTITALVHEAIGDKLEGVSRTDLIRSVRLLADRITTIDGSIGVIADFIVDAHRKGAR